MRISENLKEFLQENKNLLADGRILELYGKLYPYSGKLGGELTDLLLDSGINVWDYFTEEIPHHAFAGSTIKILEIPSSVKSIAEHAFWGCKSLISVTMPSGIANIGDGVFEDCNSLTSVTIGSGVTIIDFGAFYNCISLTSVTIPNSVTSIGSYAFYGCISLTGLTLPRSIRHIGGNVFAGCWNVHNINYLGTTDQWNSIIKENSWAADSGIDQVICTDGSVELV